MIYIEMVNILRDPWQAKGTPRPYCPGTMVGFIVPDNSGLAISWVFVFFFRGIWGVGCLDPHDNLSICLIYGTILLDENRG